MEFKRDDCTFSITEHPTVRQQMMYFSAGAGMPIALRHWEGAKTLIEKWECPAFPDYMLDLDSVADPGITSILIWAGAQVINFMSSLESLPKN